MLNDVALEHNYERELRYASHFGSHSCRRGTPLCRTLRLVCETLYVAG